MLVNVHERLNKIEAYLGEKEWLIGEKVRLTSSMFHG